MSGKHHHWKTALGVLALGVGLAAFAKDPAPSAKEKTGVFEWFLETWIDVKTKPKDKVALAKLQMKKCLHCHQANNTWNVPYVPLDREAKLLEWMRERREFRGQTVTGYDVVMTLLWEEQHMPKSAIQYHERKALKEYLETLWNQSATTSKAQRGKTQPGKSQ